MMFETPNASAFHVVAQFLFAKLDKCRAAQVFRDCALPVGRLKATEFRKKCCSWLKEIKNEDQSRFPNLAPSALLSPGGPKFIHLMYCFARHAVLQDMKRNYIDTDVPFAGAVELAPKDVKMARARCGVASNKLLQVIQKENLLIEEYKKKSQLLIQEIKEMKSECEALQLKSFKMKENDPNDKIQKVRSIWTGIMEDLASLTKGKEVVDNILQGSVGQHVLDGASVVLRIPQILAHRVENDVHQHWSGNVYEAGNLNFLMVIRLLNEALRTLRDEICQSELTPRLAYIEDMNVKCTQALQNLKSVWINLMQRYYDPRSESISREQEDWAVKWKNFLGLCPFNLMVERNPQLGLLRASPPHSFHPSEDYDDSMFYQHLSNADTCKFVHEVGNEKDDEASETVMDTTTTASGWSATTARRISSVPLELSEACENRDALIEKIARTVVSESPQSDEDKGMALEDALSSLALNSFLTRKQIPQTPENLLTEIRSSWRKSLRPDDLDTELPSAKVMRGEAPVDAGPITQVLADPISMCSSPTSPTADSDPFLSERKSLLRSSEVKPQKKMRISHVTQSPILEISGMRETERTREQELKCIGNFSVQNVSSGEDPEESSWHVKRSVNTVGSYSEDKFIISVPPSDHCQDSSMNRLLNQNVSPLLRPIHCESVMSWIMDETFPEDSMDTTEFASSDSVFDVTIADVSGDSKNKGDIQESKQDLQSLFSPRKALKKTASASEEELHQAHNEGECASCTPDENLKPETSFELFGPLVPFSLDDAFIKTPSPASPSERKYSLSSLLASCQRVEEMTPMVHDLPLSLVSKLKEMGLLNEELGPKEPSSG